jgi:nitrogen regulatory protein PII
MTIFRLIPLFVPLIRAIIKAARRGSPGGKKILVSELEDLFFAHTPDIIEGIDKEVNR